MYGESSADKSYLINGGAGGNNPRRLAFIIVFVLWNILLFCLAISGVAIANKNGDSDSSSSTTASSCVTATIPLYSAINSAKGSAVSLTYGGVARLGGGTTIYKKQRVAATSVDLVDYVMIPFSDIAAFLMWVDNSNNLHYSVGYIGENDIMTWGTPVNTTNKANNLSGVILNSNLLLVASSVGIITIVPTPLVTIYMPNDGGVAASTDTKICALSVTSFAVSFPNSQGYQTQVGVVKGTTPVIDWSANNAEYAQQDVRAHSLACINTETYLINYITGNNIASQAVTYNVTADTVSLGTSATLANANPSSFIKSITLSTFEAVSIYIDVAASNSLVARTISFNGQGIVFGSSLLINSGGSVEIADNEEDFVDVYRFINGAFMVSFADWSNNDRVTIVIGQLTESGSLALVSPNYVVSPANADVLADQYWTKIVALSSTSFVNVFTLQNGTHAVNLASSTGHVLNPPIGVITDFTELDGFYSVVVGLSGECQAGEIVFEVGYNYYSDSLGSLFPHSPSETPLYDYVDLNTVILSKNNIVGVGLSKEELLIKTEVY